MTDFEAPYFRRVYRDYPAQNPDRKLAFYRRIIEEWAPSVRPLELLDLGCGPGRFLAFLDRAGGVRASGTDVSELTLAFEERLDLRWEPRVTVYRWRLPQPG